MAHLAWTAAIFRILAIWLACSILIRVPATLGALLETASTESEVLLRAFVLPTIVTWLTSALIVAGLWRGSDRLASLVWSNPNTPLAQPNLSATALQQAVLIGFGVYLVVYGLPNLTELAAGYYTLPTGFGLEQGYSGRMWARAIGVGVQIAAGIALIVYSGNMARRLSDHLITGDDSTEDA